MEHMDGLFSAHKGDSECELLKALQDTNVDIGTYHGGCIVGNRCMYLSANANQIMNAMSKAMLPKIKDADNRRYLNNTNIQMKHILKLWYELMRTMKSVEYQIDDNCKKFKENTIELNKAVNSLVNTPPPSPPHPRSRMWAQTF